MSDIKNTNNKDTKILNPTALKLGDNNKILRTQSGGYQHTIPEYVTGTIDSLKNNNIKTPINMTSTTTDLKTTPDPLAKPTLNVNASSYIPKCKAPAVTTSGTTTSTTYQNNTAQNTMTGMNNTIKMGTYPNNTYNSTMMQQNAGTFNNNTAIPISSNYTNFKSNYNMTYNNPNNTTTTPNVNYATQGGYNTNNQYSYVQNQNMQPNTFGNVGNVQQTGGYKGYKNQNNTTGFTNNAIANTKLNVNNAYNNTISVPLTLNATSTPLTTNSTLSLSTISKKFNNFLILYTNYI
jgi:hypothetical protein